MPLIKSGSRKAIGQNIGELEKSGRPKRQAIAIALDVARESGADIRKRGHKPKRDKR